MLPIISCRKEPKLSVSEKSMFPSSLRIDMTGISSDKNMLVFTTKVLFDSTLAELDALNLKDTVVHYDNSESIMFRTELDNFENNFQYQSLRKYLEEQKIIYLNTGGDPNVTDAKDGFELDDNNPDKYFIADIAMQSVLNKYNEVKIDGKVYKIINRGLMLEISNCDQNLLDGLRNGTTNYYFENNITVKHLNSGPVRGGCFADYTYIQDVDNIQVSASPSYSDVDITDYYWQWGDGLDEHHMSSYASHTYASSGNFSVKLTITCSDGCTSTVTYYIVAIGSGTCHAVFVKTLTSGNSNFSFTSTSTADQGTISSYFWTFGDNASSTLQNPNHNYSSAGTYTVTLTITTSLGCSSTFSKTVTVNIDCHQNLSTGLGKQYGSTYVLDAIAWNNNDWLNGHNIKSRMWHYKIKSNGHWKEEKANLAVAMWGSIYDGNCTAQSTQGSNDPWHNGNYDKDWKYTLVTTSGNNYVSNGHLHFIFQATHGYDYTDILIDY